MHPDAGTYFGFGRLGVPYADPVDASLRFVDIKGYRKFSAPVPVRNAVWTETGTAASPQFQAAVRELSTYDYHRLLIAGGVTLGDIETLPMVDDLLDGLVSPLSLAPKDALRTAAVIPDGTGYVWQGGAMPNLAESAALQERAGADHQRVLRHISQLVETRGGSWFFNNNIDLPQRAGDHQTHRERSCSSRTTSGNCNAATCNSKDYRSSAKTNSIGSPLSSTADPQLRQSCSYTTSWDTICTISAGVNWPAQVGGMLMTDTGLFTSYYILSQRHRAKLMQFLCLYLHTSTALSNKHTQPHIFRVFRLQPDKTKRGRIV